MSNFSFLKTEDGLSGIVQHDVERFGSIMGFVDNILRGKSELSIAERELVFAYVSASNSCSYCYGVHKAVAQKFGIDEGLLEQLVLADDLTVVDDKIMHCLKLAKKAVKEAYQIVKSDIDAMVAIGWSEKTAHDIITIAATATFCNILVDGHGVKGSSALFEQAAERLGPGGRYQSE
jgi:uncharacterized peroxidase-related enzyme